MIAAGDTRYSGSGCVRTKSCGFGFPTGIVMRSFLTPTVSAKFWSRRNDFGSKGLGAVELVMTVLRWGHSNLLPRLMAVIARRPAAKKAPGIYVTGCTY